MKYSHAILLVAAVAVDAFVHNQKPALASREAPKPATFARCFQIFQSDSPTAAELAFSSEEQRFIESIHEKITASSNRRDTLKEALPTLSTSLLFRLRQATEDANPVIKKVAVKINDLLDEQLSTARDSLKELLDAGEIRKLDSLIGKANREGRLDTAFFNVLTFNLQDAAKSQEASNEEGAASRLQILQHIYTRCQEEVEKSIPPGLALLNKLLRTPEDPIRRNLYSHYLTPQKTKITSPDGKEIELGGTSAPLVAMQDFIDGIAQTVKQIRTVETVGATDKVSAANMVESCRSIAKEARAIIGESYGVESDELLAFEDGLMPVFRPSSAESPYMSGEK